MFYPFPNDGAHCDLGNFQHTINCFVPFPRSMPPHNSPSEFDGQFLGHHGSFCSDIHCQLWDHISKVSPFGLTDGRSRHCPYLDTINRSVLDFDFEKLCSVSLSHINVYACLVCGKYFQGRGPHSHAYTHSVQVGHHVFLNLHTLRFYCLPDNYQVLDSSLDDVTYVLRPTFMPEQIRTLDKQAKLARAYDGSTYLPGIVGLNNIKANDYANVVFQALSNVPPLRNYFLSDETGGSLQPANNTGSKGRAYGSKSKVLSISGSQRPPGSPPPALLWRRFGELLRKLWNPRGFKAHVSPHEMLQAVVLCSHKRFQITRQGESSCKVKAPGMGMVNSVYPLL
uniref:ubiquitinyl hydrolase 1 n=1 Tax=Eptatretus burgeri TaxID=7764 RepID=A0A8C4Q5R4_EPTBU